MSKEDIAFRKMRHLVYILLLVMPAVSCSRDDGTPHHERIDISSVAMSDTVWVCTSSGAKRFHASDTCRGLRSCGERIVPCTRAEAEQSFRTYCHRCYISRDNVGKANDDSLVLGEYLYIDALNILHVDRKCSGISKIHGATPVTIYPLIEIQSECWYSICSKCVSGEILADIKRQIEANKL